ncbi:hypothetical protein [Nostoc sp.]|uniref:hypothetical protein n=1 Tax=Nostoc sp. TaxID=1180 RepID=UPI002FFB4EC3
MVFVNNRWASLRLRSGQVGIEHWTLVLSVRVASRREAVGAASRREVLGISF